MSEIKKDCPCNTVEQLKSQVKCHEEKLHDHEEQLNKHDERLERGNVDFAVINTKLNFVVAVLSAVGVAICGAIIALIF